MVLNSEGGCSIPGGQPGWGPGQAGLLGSIPAYSRGLELGGLQGPFQPEPRYDSITLQLDVPGVSLIHTQDTYTHAHFLHAHVYPASPR